MYVCSLLINTSSLIIILISSKHNHILINSKQQSSLLANIDPLLKRRPISITKILRIKLITTQHIIVTSQHRHIAIIRGATTPCINSFRTAKGILDQLMGKSFPIHQTLKEFSLQCSNKGYEANQNNTIRSGEKLIIFFLRL